MPPLTTTDFDRVRDAAREAVEKHQVPGLSIAIVSGDDLVFSEAYGYADIESQQPMDPARRQCIASISKTMVGLCAMALVDEGKLRLEDRVTGLLPEVSFEGPGDSMTVWNLLTHTSGIGEATSQQTLAGTISPDADARRKPGDFASMYTDPITTEFKPGTKWHYANHGFNLLGEIVRRAEEAATLHDVMQRRIFGPLGMKDTDILGENVPTLTTPYHRAPNEDTRAQLARAGIPVREESPVDGHNIRGKFGGEFNKAALPSGGVQSTIPDMARYASALLQRGGAIVRPETFAAMIAPQYCPNPRLINWGLSFSRVPLAGRTILGHGGAYFGGWNSSLALLPEQNLAILQHMNVMLDNPSPVFHHIDRAVLDAPLPTFAERATDPLILESAPGLYELTPGRLTNFRPATGIGRITIARDSDGLSLRSRWGAWKTGTQLIPCDDRDPSFFAIVQDGREPAYIALTRGPDGRVTGLRCDRLAHMVRKDAP